MHQTVENAAYGLATYDLWDRILGLIEQDLEERRSRKLFVEVAAETAALQANPALARRRSGSSPRRNARASTRS